MFNERISFRKFGDYVLEDVKGDEEISEKVVVIIDVCYEEKV